MGCLWCGKYSRRWKTMPSGPPEFIQPFIPVTGMKCSYGKLSSSLTEISVGKTKISGTEPARPLTWTHRKFYKGFRGKTRSRKPGQPGQPSSYEDWETLSLAFILALAAILEPPPKDRSLTTNSLNCRALPVTSSLLRLLILLNQVPRVCFRFA